MDRDPKSKMLLVSANTVTNPYPVFPLGLAYLESALKNAGHEVRIWDQLVHPDSTLQRDIQWADRIGVSLRNIDNVSSTAPETFLSGYKELVTRIRRISQSPLILGGSAFSIFPEEILDALNLDWGLVGESETALLKWLDALNGMGTTEEVPGLFYRDPSGQIKQSPALPDADTPVPVSRPDKEWIQEYLKIGGMLNSQTQRGCALRCTYCTYPWIEGKRYRYRNADQVVQELRHLKESGVRYVFLTDSVFNTANRHVISICKALIRDRVQLSWGCFARPQKIDAEILDLMIEAGMQHIEFGSDSFCDTTLKSYQKSFRFKDIVEASNLAATRNVHTCHYIIFGGPGETEETIRETVENSRLLPDAPIFAFTGMRIYPHTPLHSASGSPKTSQELLDPEFYQSSALKGKDIMDLIRRSTKGLDNWILSDHAENHSALISQMRARGKQGPLWEYLALAKRMNKQPVSNTRQT